MNWKLELAGFCILVLVLAGGIVAWDTWVSADMPNVQNAEMPYMTPDATKLLPTVPIPAQSENNIDLALASINSSVSDAGWPDISNLFGEIVKPVGPVQADPILYYPMDDSAVYGYDKELGWFLIENDSDPRGGYENADDFLSDGGRAFLCNDLDPSYHGRIRTICEAW